MFTKALANIFSSGLVVVLWVVVAVLALVLIAPAPIAIYLVRGTWVMHEAANGGAGEPGVVVKAWAQPRTRWGGKTCKGEFRPDGKTQTVVAGFEAEQWTAEAKQCPVPTRGRLVHINPWSAQVVKDDSTEWYTWAFAATLPVLWMLGLAWLVFRRLRRNLRGPRPL